jgi:hypothetical protein
LIEMMLMLSGTALVTFDGHGRLGLLLACL